LAPLLPTDLLAALRVLLGRGSWGLPGPAPLVICRWLSSPERDPETYAAVRGAVAFAFLTIQNSLLPLGRDGASQTGAAEPADFLKLPNLWVGPAASAASLQLQKLPSRLYALVYRLLD